LGIAVEPAQRADIPGISFIEDREIYVVHGFIKKTQTTPPADLALAMRCLKETRE